MAKRRRHQRAHRVTDKEALAKIVHGLEKSPEELQKMLDGRTRTRSVPPRRKHEPTKGGKRAEVKRAEREHE